MTLASLPESTRRLLEVERLALCEFLLRRDVEQHHVAELLGHCEVRELATDVTRADEANLLSCHFEILLSNAATCG